MCVPSAGSLTCTLSFRIAYSLGKQQKALCTAVQYKQQPQKLRLNLAKFCFIVTVNPRLITVTVVSEQDPPRFSYATYCVQQYSSVLCAQANLSSL